MSLDDIDEEEEESHQHENLNFVENGSDEIINSRDSRPDLLKSTNDPNLNPDTGFDRPRLWSFDSDRDLVENPPAGEMIDSAKSENSDKLQEELYGELVQRFGHDPEYDEKVRKRQSQEFEQTNKEDQKKKIEKFGQVKPMSVELLAEEEVQRTSYHHSVIVIPIKENDSSK